MIDLYNELGMIVAKLESKKIEYGLCGGLAMGVYGLPRATIDIDMLLREDDLPVVLGLARELGYDLDALPMNFKSIRIRRVSKIDPGSGVVLSLDVLLVGPEIEDVWRGRRRAKWEKGELSVVSPQGLIKLKQSRGSGQDLDDIERLRGFIDDEKANDQNKKEGRDADG